MRTMKTTTTKKRRLALFVALIMALSLWTALPLQASAATAAQTVTNGDFIYFIPAYDSAAPNATIIGYTGNDASPTVPGTVDGAGGTYTVDRIGAGAFAANPSITSITIPSNITRVDANAFYACTELASVTFTTPANLLDVGNYAFYNTKLAAIDASLPTNATTGKINIVGQDTSVVTGVAGDYRYSVANGAATLWNFTGNPSAASIPASVTVSGISYPVTGLGAGTFNGRASLTSITIPEGVTDIGVMTFRDTALASIAIADSVTSIGTYAFYSCTNLSTVTISASSGLTCIDGGAFQGASLLSSIIIPDSLESIGGGAFYGCTNLSTVTISASSNLTSIGVNAFTVCTSLTSISLPNSLETIGNAAFQNTGLTSVTIPASIDTSAFQGCTSLNSVTLSDGVETIGENAFYGCTNLATVTISASSSLTSIGDGAFHSAPLTSITLPDSLTSIGEYAFYNCVNLNTVTISATSNLTSIGNFAFQSDAALTSINIPASIETIGGYAFHNCTVLSGAIEISEGVTSIGEYAFHGTNLTEVTIWGTSTNVDATAFAGTPENLKIWLYNANEAAKTAAGTKAVIMIESIALDNEPLPLTNSAVQSVGTLSSLPATVSLGSLEPIPTITWDTLNPILATVDASGNVTVAASGHGSAIITATITTHAGVELTASRTVAVADTTPLATPHTLDVVNGSGGGSFTQGAIVTIIAEDIDGQEFIGWTGGAGDNYNAAQSPTVLTMPDSDTTVTATYRWAPPVTDIDYVNEKLTGLEANVSYTFGSTQGNAAADGTYPITETWMNGSPLSIVKKSDGTVADSDSQSLLIPARPIAPTSVSKDDETASGSGKLVGVTNAMEYRLGTSGNWTVGDGSDIDRAPGSYQVRTKATTTEFASAVATLTIAAYVPTPPPAPTTYSVTVTNGTGSASYEEGATVTITANAPATGKLFDTWTTSDVTLTDATSATTTFTMPAKAVTVTAMYKDDPNADGGDDPNPPVDPPATEDNGWVQNEDGEWEYLVDGEAKTGWVYDQSTWYYTNSDGIMQTGWEYVGSSWYYLAGNGEMKTGWVKDKNTWYYLTGSGAMKTGWQKDNGSWYYLGGNGAMVTGKWLHDTDGSWYYLSGNGKMLTGKQTIGSKTYTFKSNGVWIS